MTQRKTKKPTHKKPKTRPAKKKTTKKKRSGKAPLLIVIILILAIGGGLFYLLTNINMIVKTAIEKYGSKAIQTAVRVRGVDIRLKDGSGAIKGLTVGNPKGFDASNAFALGEIALGIDIKSIPKDVKIIKEITIKAPEIYTEVNKENKMNLNELQKNLATPAPKKSESKKESTKPPPKLIIRKIHFSDGLIHSKIVPLDKEYELKLPAFYMRNVGAPNGATPDKIAAQILKELTKRSLTQVRKKSVDQYAKPLTDKARSTLEDQKDKLKGLLK